MTACARVGNVISLFPLIRYFVCGTEFVLADVCHSKFRRLRRDLGYHTRGTFCGRRDWLCRPGTRMRLDWLPQQYFGLDKRLLERTLSAASILIIFMGACKTINLRDTLRSDEEMANDVIHREQMRNRMYNDAAMLIQDWYLQLHNLPPVLSSPCWFLSSSSLADLCKSRRICRWKQVLHRRSGNHLADGGLEEWRFTMLRDVAIQRVHLRVVLLFFGGSEIV